MSKIKRFRRKSRKAKRGVYRASKSVEPIRYRSRWELEFAMWLDASPMIASFRYEPFPIEYVSNQRTLRRRKYWPDFEVTFANGSVRLVEIKPLRKKTHILNIKKFAAAEAFCQARDLTFVVLTEVDLKALGLLR